MVKLLCCLAVAMSTQAGTRPPTTPANAPADVFAIYLVADQVDGRITAYGRGEWSQLRLAASPLITGDDLVSYEWSTHAMKLRREALARIPRPPVHGTPFVVVANGQRVYLGAFVTILSSMPFAVPTISIDAQMVHPEQTADTLVIERAYPSPSFGTAPDPRSDERIKKALTALGKVR
jgi:hypothetical protein